MYSSLIDPNTSGGTIGPPGITVLTSTHALVGDGVGAGLGWGVLTVYVCVCMEQE